MLGNGGGQMRADGQLEVLICLVGKAEEIWVRGSGWNQTQQQRGKDNPHHRQKPPVLWGLISARSAVDCDSGIPRQGGTGQDVGCGCGTHTTCMAHPAWPALQPDSLSQTEPSGRGWVRQPSKREKRRRAERSSFTKGAETPALERVSRSKREFPGLLQEGQGRSCQVHGQPEA